MRNCIAVYTCWTTGKDGAWELYDHPTPVSQEGEVPRMLANFVKRGIKDHVLLFPGPTNPVIEKHLQKIAKRFPLDVHVLTGEDIKGIWKALMKAGFPSSYEDVFNMNMYGRLRNMSLMYAITRGFDNVIQVDDDEIIDDPSYMKKALGDMGKKFKGKTIYGKSGYYIDAKGSKFYDGQVKVPFETWPKDDLFNAAVKQAFQRKGPITDCHVAFGGNMAINSKLFLHVPYDQIALPRGEDDDYVIQAHYKGFAYVFDQNMWVTHLPPKRGKRFWARMRSDVRRFKYLREKMKLLGVQGKDLGVFFGYFLQDDLEQKAVTAFTQAAQLYIDSDPEEAKGFLGNIHVALESNREEMRKKAERQLRFMDHWSKYMPKVEGVLARKGRA